MKREDIEGVLRHEGVLQGHFYSSGYMYVAGMYVFTHICLCVIHFTITVFSKAILFRFNYLEIIRRTHSMIR